MFSSWAIEGPDLLTLRAVGLVGSAGAVHSVSPALANLRDVLSARVFGCWHANFAPVMQG